MKFTIGFILGVVSTFTLAHWVGKWSKTAAAREEERRQRVVEENVRRRCESMRPAPQRLPMIQIGPNPLDMNTFFKNRLA